MARLILTQDSIPRLPRHIVLRHDKLRERWVILAPERVLVPDDIAVTVLRRLDGHKTIGEIAADLARDYAAPLDRIETDITTLLQDLADKNFLTATEAVTHG